jgi:hypothetical protein
MVISPGVMPVTTPVTGSTEPIAGLLLLHTPPVGRHMSASVPPTHTLQPVETGQVIGPGIGFTVKLSVEKHPVLSI